MTSSGNDKALMAEIHRRMEQQGLKRPADGRPEFYTGYGTVLYDWDAYFDTIALAYFGGEKYAANGLRYFLDAQRSDGFIPRRILIEPRPSPCRVFEAEEHCKPFLCQIALMIAHITGTMERADFDKLARYLGHWLAAWDSDQNGLCEWASAPHSGADTQFARVGPWRSRYCEGVDLNCYLYRELLAAARLADAMQQPAAQYHQRAAALRQRIRECLWDEADGFFYDRNAKTGERIRVQSASGFLPLWAGIATAEQARLLVKRHLTNPNEFWTACPVASLARSEPGYAQFYQPPPGSDPITWLEPGHANWCGGMWPHWNYFIAHGLQDYGYHAEARHIAERFHTAVAADPGLYEWYDAETGRGQGMHPFCAGATILGAMLHAEIKLNVDPTRITEARTKLDLSPVRQLLGIPCR
jgi:hypothetical protein